MKYILTGIILHTMAALCWITSGYRAQCEHPEDEPGGIMMLAVGIIFTAFGILAILKA